MTADLDSQDSWRTATARALRKRRLLETIREAGAISKELNDELASTLVEFKSTWR